MSETGGTGGGSGNMVWVSVPIADMGGSILAVMLLFGAYRKEVKVL
jgi:hypothetical protein